VNIFPSGFLLFAWKHLSQILILTGVLIFSGDFSGDIVCEMEGITHPIPRTVEEVFSDFRGRRAGLIKALTNGQFWSDSCFSLANQNDKYLQSYDFVAFGFFIC